MTHNPPFSADWSLLETGRPFMWVSRALRRAKSGAGNDLDWDSAAVSALSNEHQLTPKPAIPKQAGR